MTPFALEPVVHTRSVNVAESGNALIISLDVHRRLVAYQYLAEARYRVVVRRSTSRMLQDQRIYRPDVIVVDASCLHGSPGNQSELRRVCLRGGVLVLSEDPPALPAWARPWAVEIASLPTCVKDARGRVDVAHPAARPTLC